MSNLKGDATAEERFEFFQAIIQSMKDMTLETVTELRLSSEDVQTDEAFVGDHSLRRDR